MILFCLWYWGLNPRPSHYQPLVFFIITKLSSLGLSLQSLCLRFPEGWDYMCATTPSLPFHSRDFHRAENFKLNVSHHFLELINDTAVWIWTLVMLPMFKPTTRQLLVLLVFYVNFLVSLIFALVFITFLLNWICSSFSRFPKWRLGWQILDLLIYTLMMTDFRYSSICCNVFSNAICIIPSTSYTASYKFW